MNQLTEVRERPILFSAPMIRAILARQKTMTRRVIKPQPNAWRPDHLFQMHPDSFSFQFGNQIKATRCPYGKVGDRLWCRETWQAWEREPDGLDFVRYRADDAKLEIPNDWHCGNDICGKFDKWHPSIFMRRWMSRIDLTVLDVRVERVQDISEADATAEGVEAVSLDAMPRNATWSNRQDFSQLWDLINAKRGFGWQTNSWVYVVEFEATEHRELIKR